jgi:ketosteroid isomerase-like protein
MLDGSDRFRRRGAVAGGFAVGRSAAEVNAMPTSEPIRSTIDQEPARSDAGSSLRREIAAANARFMEAFRAGDARAVTACYTSAAQLFPAGSDVVEGAEAITGFWRGGMEAGIANVRLDTAEVDERGDLAVEVGRYTLLAADGGTIDRGKYLVVWKREDGAARIHRDIWNTSVAAPAS